MPITRQQKEEMVKELVADLKKAKSVVFTQYEGTKVKDVRDLRKQLRAKSVKFKVTRKTLMSIAAKEVGLPEISAEILKGAIGLAMAMEDAVAPAKVVNDFGKAHETVKITGAIFEGKLMSAAEAKVIAMLPGREVLLARLVGSMKSPISGFHGVLHGLLRNFVYVLGEVGKKRPA